MKKDIKVKPTDTKPKILEKAGNIPKDAKIIMREQLVSQAENMKPEFKDKSQQNETNYATDKVEGGMQRATNETLHAADNAKDYAIKKIKEHKADKAQASETPPSSTPQNQPQSLPEANNAPKTRESYQQSTENHSAPPKDRAREYVQKSQADKIKTKESLSKVEQTKTSVDNKPPIKTKEQYIKAQGKKNISNIDNTPKTLKPTTKYKSSKLKGKIEHTADNGNVSSVSKIKAKEYVIKKHKEKKQLEKAEQTEQTKRAYQQTHSELPTTSHNESSIKTKENYRLSENGTTARDNIKVKKADIKTFDSKSAETARLKLSSHHKAAEVEKNIAEKTVNSKIKQRTLTKGTVKTRKGNIGNGTSSYTFKGGKGIKTSKKVLKKVNAAKMAQKKATQAARRKATKKAAQETARRTAQAAKATAHAIKVIAVKAAQAIAAAAKAVSSAIAALGGWAVLLMLLIIVIIVAAIAASPFGIFISDEAADSDSIPISSIVAECNVELSQILTDIEDSTPHNRVVMEGEQADWSLILPIFAVKVAGVEDDTVQDVVVIDEEKKQKLKDVFWDMNSVTSRTETVTNGENSETVLYITITAKTKEEMIAQYNFTRKQQEALETLLENSDAYIGATQSLAISDATAKEVLNSLPDNLSQERKAVIKAACSLVGKVNYFWGGKSAAIGWDSEWGKMKLVTAEGSRSSGTMRPFGLDCSGFVTWCFINSGFSASSVGHGTQSQVASGSRISLSSAQPGDLAFVSDVSHVGIVAGKDTNGNTLVIHCSSGANNVVINTGTFTFAVRPRCY